jgi:hypothetical protein
MIRAKRSLKIWRIIHGIYQEARRILARGSTQFMGGTTAGLVEQNEKELWELH